MDEARMNGSRCMCLPYIQDRDIILAVMDEGMYFFEQFPGDVVRGIKIDKVYYEGKTKFQHVQIVDSHPFGKILFLDRKIQSAQIDERTYHEALVHPPLITHPAPKDVLIIGGGEGATLREVLRHDPVCKVFMVDIDQELVKLCQEYLPEWSDGAFGNPKTHLVFGEARRFVEDSQESYDVIISDLTDPADEGPSVYLFTEEFFKNIHEVLTHDGLFVLQAGSTDPLSHEFFASCTKTLEEFFPIVRPYWVPMFSFGLPWGFVVASKKEDPLGLAQDDVRRRIKKRKITVLQYYDPSLHRALFALPPYLKAGLKKGKILTDKKPFIGTV